MLTSSSHDLQDLDYYLLLYSVQIIPLFFTVSTSSTSFTLMNLILIWNFWYNCRNGGLQGATNELHWGAGSEEKETQGGIVIRWMQQFSWNAMKTQTDQEAFF